MPSFTKSPGMSRISALRQLISIGLVFHPPNHSVTLVGHQIGLISCRETFEATYSISIRKPKEGEDPDRPPTHLELLNAYASMRGFMTQSGNPDCPRGARILLKDFVNVSQYYDKQ